MTFIINYYTPYENFVLIFEHFMKNRPCEINITFMTKNCLTYHQKFTLNLLKLAIFKAVMWKRKHFEDRNWKQTRKHWLFKEPEAKAFFYETFYKKIFIKHGVKAEAV